jgi:hypothetical protein
MIDHGKEEQVEETSGGQGQENRRQVECRQKNQGADQGKSQVEVRQGKGSQEESRQGRTEKSAGQEDRRQETGCEEAQTRGDVGAGAGIAARGAGWGVGDAEYPSGQQRTADVN